MNEEVRKTIKRHPYLKEFLSRMIIGTKEDVERFKNSRTILTSQYEVSVEFLNTILNDDYYYEEVFKKFRESNENITITFLVYGDLGASISYSKVSIVEGIEELIRIKDIKLNDKVKRRIDRLKYCTSFDRYVEDHINEVFYITIDLKDYQFPVKDLLYILQMPNEEFERICKFPSVKEVKGYPKEHIIYAAYKMAKKHHITRNYIAPLISYKVNNNEAYQIIDLQAINQFLTTTDSLYKKIKLNKELEKHILSNLPEDASLLEKAIYIYIKMCKTFTYDDEYFSTGQVGYSTKRHKSVNHLSDISLENNEIVCFEFNLIYSYFLNKLGINFLSDYHNLVGEAYGDGHANIEFRAGKFLVSADSVTRILCGDIMQAKLNQPLEGLKCINENLDTNIEFRKAVHKMYRLLAEQDQTIYLTDDVEVKQSGADILKEYSKKSSISLEDRFSILIDKIEKARMKGVDTFSYILDLRHALFNEKKRNNNFGVTIMRDKVSSNRNKEAMGCAIFYISEEGFNKEGSEIKYYYYTPDIGIVPVSEEDLERGLLYSNLEYITKDDPLIPRINPYKNLK